MYRSWRSGSSSVLSSMATNSHAQALVLAAVPGQRRLSPGMAGVADLAFRMSRDGPCIYVYIQYTHVRTYQHICTYIYISLYTYLHVMQV